jgi:hypothetical protein
LCDFLLAGVSDVVTNLSEKTVTCNVTAPASAASVEDALKKWGSASGKEVKIISA